MRPISPLFRCCHRCVECDYPNCVVPPRKSNGQVEEFERRHARMPSFTDEQTEAFHRLSKVQGGGYVDVAAINALAATLKVREGFTLREICRIFQVPMALMGGVR